MGPQSGAVLGSVLERLWAGNEASRSLLQPCPVHPGIPWSVRHSPSLTSLLLAAGPLRRLVSSPGPPIQVS